MKINYQKQGKRNLAKGRRFEAKTRKDLENKRWIVSKWQNNVDLKGSRLIPAKQGRFRKTSTGFPDFIAYKMYNVPDTSRDKGFNWLFLYDVQGIECKTNGYLTQEEKAKCKWLLDNNIFSKILIAKKGKKRGKIEYNEYGNV